MNDSTKRAVAGEAIVLVAWLVVMFACSSMFMNLAVFGLSLGFGILSFVVSTIAAVLPDRRVASRTMTEVNMLPTALCCGYFAVALAANTAFSFMSYAWIDTTVPVVVNVILLAAFVIVQMGLNSYGKQAEQNVAKVAAKVSQSAQFGSYVGQLIATADDDQLKAELKALQDDISFSSNMSQPHVQEIEQQFSAALEAIANSMASLNSADTTIAFVQDARRIWKKRNAALTAVK